MNTIIRNTSRKKQALCAGMLLGLASTCTVSAFAASGESMQSRHSAETASIEGPTGSLFEYLTIAGSTFRAQDSGTIYTYPGGGCIAKTGGIDSLLSHRVILPQGSVAKFLRIYYYDTNATKDVLSWFTTYDGAGTFNQRTTISSGSGASGYGTAVSSEIDFSVNHATSAINVTVNLASQTDGSLQFCGVRIAYTPPITDRIFASGFDSIPI